MYDFHNFISWYFWVNLVIMHTSGVPVLKRIDHRTWILNSEKFYAIFFLHYKLHCVILTFTLLKCKCKSWTWLLAYACVKKKRGLTRLTSTTQNSKSRIYIYILKCKNCQSKATHPYMFLYRLQKWLIY